MSHNANGINEPVRPQSLTFRGRVSPSGYLFDTQYSSLGEARRRVLSVWAAGSRVYRAPDGLVVVLPQTGETVQAEQALGAPLVRINNVLYSAPLTDKERKELAAPVQSIVLVRGGKAQVFAPNELPEENPSAYLELGPTNTLSLTSLSDSLPPARDAIAERPFDSRAQTNVPPALPEQSDVLKALQDAANRPRPTNQNLPAQTGGLGQGGLLFDLARKLRDSLGLGGTGAGTGQGGQKGKQSRAEQMRELTQHLGKQHADYMNKMLGLFEQGDLYNALRHAIPLSGLNENGPDLPRHPEIYAPATIYALGQTKSKPIHK